MHMPVPMPVFIAERNCLSLSDFQSCWGCIAKPCPQFRGNIGTGSKSMTFITAVCLYSELRSWYHTGDGITVVDTNSNDASASAGDGSSDAPAPATDSMMSNSGIPFDGASNCSDVVLDYKFTLQGSFNRVDGLLFTTVAACGQEVRDLEH